VDPPEPVSKDPVMHASENRTGRAFKRLAAVTAAAALGAGAFASPAAAQVPELVESSIRFEETHYVGGDPSFKTFEGLFGDDFTPGVHTVVFTLTVDAPEGVFTFSEGDIGGRCEVNSDHTEVVCTQVAADQVVSFEFAEYITAEGVYPYTSDIAVDGVSVAHIEGFAEVLPDNGSDARYPYMYFATEHAGVEPGSSVDVRPSFLQEDALPADTAAIILQFGHSTLGDVARAVADYDNCFSRGDFVTCAVTEFPDEVGTYFEPSGPIVYEVGEDAPGPVDVCECLYKGYAADAESLANHLGDHTWDPDSDRLLGLREGEDPGTEQVDAGSGRIAIATTANPVDLSVGEVDVTGAKGTESTIEIEVANGGPAVALPYSKAMGAYAVLGSLPTGLTLVSIDAPDWIYEEPVVEWICLERSYWEEYLPELTPGELEALDFACFFAELGVGEKRSVSMTVRIAESASASDGKLEVVSLGYDGDPGVGDADPSNNTAEFSVKVTGAGQLPATGTSLTMVTIIAGLVLAAGGLLLVLTSRLRRTSAAANDALANGTAANGTVANGTVANGAVE
jgi:LPXTG-motif cell wall-anchored protein